MVQSVILPPLKVFRYSTLRLRSPVKLVGGQVPVTCCGRLTRDGSHDLPSDSP